MKKTSERKSSPWRNRIVGYSEEPPDQLLANPLNWRIHPGSQQAALSGMLGEVGLVQNVVVNRTTNTLVDGHLRVMLAMREGQPTLPVTWVELSEEEERLILATLDPLAAMATADAGALDALLSSVRSGEAAVTEMLAELAKGAGLYEPPESLDAEPQVDRAEELRQQWGVELGQLWRLPSRTPGQEHRLICGDCTDAAVVGRVMGGEKAALVVTSPPYAVGKEYEVGVSFDQHICMLQGVADRCIENVLPGGFIFVNFDEIAALSHAGPLTGSKRQCVYPISKDYWRIFHDERGCDLYAQRIWYKPFNRLQQPFWSYKTSIPHHQEWEHIWTWRTPGGDGDRPTDWDISVRAVWDTRNEASEDRPLTRHTAAFPVGIPERAIKAHSLPSEIVLEPFSGSGTTIIVAENLGRHCRAVEISAPYVSVALQRYLDTFGIEPELIP